MCERIELENNTLKKDLSSFSPSHVMPKPYAVIFLSLFLNTYDFSLVV